MNMNRRQWLKCLLAGLATERLGSFALADEAPRRTRAVEDHIDARNTDCTS